MGIFWKVVKKINLLHLQGFKIKVILINLSNEVQIIEDGDRIAQMVFQPVEKVSLQQVDTLDSTERGEGGFGHTGKK